MDQEHASRIQRRNTHHNGKEEEYTPPRTSQAAWTGRIDYPASPVAYNYGKKGMLVDFYIFALKK